MGIRNYLIEGVSGTGKTSVCKELRRRGHQAVNGDTELAYQGNPETGEPLGGFAHEHHIWHVDQVRALAADRDEEITFFCGGSRNFSRFIGLFDRVFILEIDIDTLNQRLDGRREDEFGGRQRSMSWSLDCIGPKKTSRRTESSSTPPRPSSELLTRSFVKALHLEPGCLQLGHLWTARFLSTSRAVLRYGGEPRDSARAAYVRERPKWSAITGKESTDCAVADRAAQFS